MPVLMNKLYSSRDAARAAQRGVLDIVLCETCGFLWNQAFDPSLAVYDSDYENDQMNSPTFQAHVEERVADVLAARPNIGMLNFMEIGCGQGSFITSILRSAAPRLCSVEGFDPAWRGDDGVGPAGSRIHKTYFDEVSANRLIHPPDLVVTRHTIEHVPRPVAFLSNIRNSLGLQSRACLFVETPSAAWILRQEAMQDLFYEHCSIFSTQALRYALEKSGFQVLRIDEVFGAQYLWAEAEARDRIAVTPPSGVDVKNLVDAPQRFIARWRAAVVEARSEGAVAIWGAGAKGVTFSNLIDPDGRLIDHVIDINPAKQGHFIAGSGLAVHAPISRVSGRLRTIFVMNPNYFDEINKQVQQSGIVARIVSLQ